MPKPNARFGRGVSIDLSCRPSVVRAAEACRLTDVASRLTCLIGGLGQSSLRLIRVDIVIGYGTATANCVELYVIAWNHAFRPEIIGVLSP